MPEPERVSKLIAMPSTRRRRLPVPGVVALLPAVLAVGLLPEPASGQAFRFRAAATRVLVDVLVLDGDGVPVPGLEAADFQLFEEGEEQQVLSVDVVDWQAYGPGAGGAEAEAAGARAGTSAVNQTPRRFVVVFNRRRADPVNLRRLKRGLVDFVSTQMVDGDETMVVEFASSATVIQDFLPGKEQTLANVRSIVPGTYQSPAGPEMDARQTYLMLYGLAESLERVPGRKIILLATSYLQTFADPRATVGEMAGTEVGQPLQRRAFDESRMLQDAIRQLNQANATLYTVAAEGAYANESNILDASGNAFDVLGNELPVEPSGPLARMDIAANLPDEGGAPSLAVATGGRFFPNMINFAEAFRRIGLENQLYYLLSFSPSRTELDGAYRQLGVSVRDRSDLRVVARPGYFARERTRPPEEAVVARGEFDYALPRNLHLYAYVLDRIPGGAVVALAAAAPEAYLDGGAELAFRVASPEGEPLGEASTELTAGRFWLSKAVRLPAGRHVFDVDVRRGGASVHADGFEIDVPEGLGDRFGVSSVFPLVAEAHRPVVEGPPVRPVASFARAEDARVALLVYRGVEEPAERVRITYEIQNARGEVAVETDRPQVVPLDPARASGMPVVLPLRTGSLRAGRYTAVIRVEDDGRDRSASGELDFEIR